MDYDKHLEEIITSGLSTKDVETLIQKLNKLRDISRAWRNAIEEIKQSFDKLEQKIGAEKSI